MTLVDAGPLVAILDPRDGEHNRCLNVLPTLSSPLVTSWPAFAEAMYLVGTNGGWQAQEMLWRLALRHDLRVESIDRDGMKRASELMHKYRDLPMDLADATLVVIAEAQKTSRIFTLDKDFRLYRLHGRKPFEIIP